MPPTGTSQRRLHNPLPGSGDVHIATLLGQDIEKWLFDSPTSSQPPMAASVWALVVQSSYRAALPLGPHSSPAGVSCLYTYPPRASRDATPAGVSWREAGRLFHRGERRAQVVTNLEALGGGGSLRCLRLSACSSGSDTLLKSSDLSVSREAEPLQATIEISSPCSSPARAPTRVAGSEVRRRRVHHNRCHLCLSSSPHCSGRAFESWIRALREPSLSGDT